jgi:hypothetical protein
MIAQATVAAAVNPHAAAVGGRRIGRVVVLMVVAVWPGGRTKGRGIEGHKYCPFSSLLFFSRGEVKAVDTVLCRANAPTLGKALRRTTGRRGSLRRVSRTAPPARIAAAQQHTQGLWGPRGRARAGTYDG